MTDVTYVWWAAADEHGVVHRVVSLADTFGVRNLCTARCGLTGRWDHLKIYNGSPIPVLSRTHESPSCMTCIVKEARFAVEDN